MLYNLVCTDKSKLKLCSWVLMFTQSWAKSWYKLLDFVQTLPSLAGQGPAMIDTDVKDNKFSAGTLIQ